MRFDLFNRSRCLGYHRAIAGFNSCWQEEVPFFSPVLVSIGVGRKMYLG